MSNISLASWLYGYIFSRMKRTQINARVPHTEAVRVKKDILDTGATLEAYVIESLIHFRKSLNIEERRNRFSSARKGAGRPVSA